MSGKRPDRRVARTRQMLRDALMALMMEQGYDAVTIQDITDRANLGRATFYLHYKDKEELLIESMESTVNRFIERMQEYPLEQWAFPDGGPASQVFEYAREHAKLYRIIMSGHGGLKVSKRLHELIANNTQKLIELHVARTGVDPQLPIDFLCNYFAGALLALVFWWLENDMPYSTDEMVRMLNQISLYGSAPVLGLQVERG